MSASPPSPPDPLAPGTIPPGPSHEAARALFEQSPFSTVLYDRAGRILAVNAAFVRLFGVTREMIPPDYTVLTDPQLAAAGSLPLVARAFAGETTVLPLVFYDSRRLDPAGRTSWTQGHFSPMRDDAGAVTGVVLVHVDLTERIEAEQAAAEARRLLEEQAAELETQAEELQQQAVEMEAQHAELEQQTEELHVLNDSLAAVNVEAEAARDAAERAAAYVAGILGSITDPLVVQDAALRIQYANEAAATILGGAPVGDASTLVGRVVWEAYPELVGTAFQREMIRARDERVAATFTGLHPRSGTWAEMRCYPMPGGGMATLWKDVTAQRRAEEARHYLGRASEILAASLDPTESARELAQLLVPRLADWAVIQIVDDAGLLERLAVAHVDPAKVEWARELNERYPEDPQARTGAYEVLRTGEPQLFADFPDALLVAVAQDAEHLRLLRAVGLRSVLTVPLAARGRVIGVMSLVAAESGRRYGEADLALARELATRAALAIDNALLYRAATRARAEAHEANRAKSDFLAMMSHELRTPLNAIGGYTQLLELGVHGPVTPAQQEALRRVQRSQQHLTALINDVLNFAKLEAGRVTYQIEPVPVDVLLRELEPLVAPMLRTKGLRYACVADAPGLAVQADPEKAQQILLNLVSNAIKFTAAGGAVRVATRVDEGVVHLDVVDTGAGIPADRLESVFEPFVQLERRSTPGQEGTGLGLAISRDLAQAMGGTVTVTSEVGRGSTFTLTLPRAAAPEDS